MAERVAIVGSRNHPNLEMVREYVRTLPAGTIVISGGAAGVDRTAENEALVRSSSFANSPIVFRPEDAVAFWGHAGEPLGRLSYRDRLLFRSTQIAVACTRMVVFPDGSKGGCWDAAREAVRFDRPVEVRFVDGRVSPFPMPPRRERRQAALMGLEGEEMPRG